jgi:hypothetical protein
MTRFSSLSLFVLFAACAVAAAARAQDANAVQAGTSLFVRTDTDQTTVISPRVHASAPIGEATRVTGTYMVDIWTSASIDIRTSASQAVTEQRDEMNLSATHAVDTTRLTGSYRYSTEPDYDSHTVATGLAQDFGDRSTTLALNVGAGFDDVGRAGEPSFTRALQTLSARASLTQLLSSRILVQLEYEGARSLGYLSSPYRYVGIGSDDATCRGEIFACVLEANPALRVRHAIAGMGRVGLLDWLSFGAGYRFYADDWAVQSHTITADVALMPDTETMIALRYRFYKQGAAEHYRPRYEEETDSGLYTRDKELAALDSYRLSLDLERAFALDDEGHVLRAVATFGPVLYFYADYPLLDRVTAFDATLSLVLEL